MMPSVVNLIAFLGYPLLITNVYASPVDIRQAGVTNYNSVVPVRRDVDETTLPLGYDASPNGTLFGHGLFEATDEQQLCARADDEAVDCSVLPPWYQNKDQLKFFSQLSDEERNGLWEEIGVEGKKMKALMDNFAGRGVSRRSEMPGPRDGHFNKYKRNEKTDEWTLLAYDTNVDKSTKAFQAAGFNNVDVRRQFGISEYVSWGPPPSRFKGPATVFLGSACPTQSALISTYYNPANDFNPVVFRAYGSTLAWGTWAIQAKAAKIKIATLKWHLLHTITDRLSNHIMAIAHDLWSMDVDQIPPGEGDELGLPQAGHGRWANDHPAFETLLGIPEVQGAANMIADYNNRMNNPYIAAIHTLPGIRVWDYPNTRYPTWRDGEIIIEFGPKPAGLAGSSLPEGTVATS